MVSTITFSTVGPTCPGCGTVFAADEPFYYDENGYTLRCDGDGGCDLSFAVRPFASWSWASKPLSTVAAKGST